MAHQTHIDDFIHSLNVTTVEEGNAKLDSILSEEHPSGCLYEDDPLFPGTCKHCRWVSPEADHDCTCGMTLRDHLSIMIFVVQEQVFVAPQTPRVVLRFSKN